MLINLFNTVRAYGIPVSLKEFLDLLRALEKNLVFASWDDFYSLSRSILVKDEKYFDKFDKAFGVYFNGIENMDDILKTLIPEEWMRQQFEKELTKEELDKINDLGGLENLMREFKKRLEEQEKEHHGGNKWVGTAGTSPFGNAGQHPNGIRVGGKSNKGMAAKVWEERNFENLDDSLQLGTRNIKMALRKLRKMTRKGENFEFSLDDTISKTAKNAGFLELEYVREKLNDINLIVFFDVGGSMDPFVKLCEELFSAAKSEFKNLEYYYFHNCIYESVWKDNFRRNESRIPTQSIINKFTHNHKVIIIGDASMAPYELTNPGGSIEHWNKESGEFWLNKIKSYFYKTVWLNPVHSDHWDYTSTIKMISGLMDKKMYPLTISGISDAVGHLSRRH
ncbi:MAG: hypothetical protein VYB12_01840 [Pseudomonadota bacterium]|jgi:hypothetical protein|nr:hypothetical protein [Gammaproteobacteria bacterium]MEC7513309.1 hypothetical protein [Pseudomonadota bacterium]GIR09202.1 MAG: VWA domain-containing protein [Gammaproteobacteria bacterium]|tara:strand:- start:1 stop:1182 length:1182 start_codon:yes stop_codon:yes gene_type:complete